MNPECRDTNYEVDPITSTTVLFFGELFTGFGISRCLKRSSASLVYFEPEGDAMVFLNFSIQKSMPFLKRIEMS